MNLDIFLISFFAYLLVPVLMIAKEKKQLTNNVMNLGLLFLKVNTSGVITLSELDWITNHQSDFSRLDMALVLKIGRLMDEGKIELDCRLPA